MKVSNPAFHGDQEGEMRLEILGAYESQSPGLALVLSQA